MNVGPPASDVFTVLFVCTGNICRSAFAERLGQAFLDDRLGEGAGVVRLDSAGCRAVVGSGMHPDSALVLRGFGGNPDGFCARQLDERLAEHADLTLTMTRAHRAEVLGLVPRALSRTFTLREAAALLDMLGDTRPAGSSLPDRARALVQLLADSRARRPSGETDDVPDPIAGPLEAHQEAGELIAEALLPVLSRITALRDRAGEAEPTGGTGAF